MLDHTIVAGNFRGSGAVRNDIVGPIAAAWSLIGDNTGATITDNGGNQIGTFGAPISAGLLPLASNGGPTMTHRLASGSLAIDNGNPAALPGEGNVPLYDQRGAGFPRRMDVPGVRDPGARIDIGAYEIGLPKVIEVSIWDSQLPAHLPHQLSKVVGDGDQIRTVPVGNANSILVVFSEIVTVIGNPITVRSAITGSPYTGTVSTTATTARWTLTSGIFTYDQLILRIDDTGVTGLGGRLDGNWTNPTSLNGPGSTDTSVFPSGNNVVDADDDFIFFFTILSGDFNHDNIVDGRDQVIWNKNQGTTSGATHSMGDANGDGAVNQADRDI
jgi:hypothetical protein